MLSFLASRRGDDDTHTWLKIDVVSGRRTKGYGEDLSFFLLNIPVVGKTTTTTQFVPSLPSVTKEILLFSQESFRRLTTCFDIQVTI